MTSLETPAPPTKELVGVQIRATWAQIALATVILAQLALIWAGLEDVALVQQMQRGSQPTPSEINGLLALLLRAQAAALGTGIFSIVTFCIWYYAAYGLAFRESPSRTIGSGAAVSSFFIPVLNLIKPYELTVALWKAGDADRTKREPWLVRWWWGTWLIAVLLGAFVAVGGSDDDTLDQLLVWDWMGIVSAGIRIAAALLAIALIRSVVDSLQRTRSLDAVITV